MNLEKNLSIQPLFNIFCLEERNIRQLKAFVKDGQVKTNKEMCGRKIVRMAYNHWDGYFELDKDMKVVKLAEHHEVLISFFSSQNLTPVWENANFDWGRFDEETGRWTGAVGLVSLIPILIVLIIMNIHRLPMIRQILVWICLLVAMPAVL